MGRKRAREVVKKGPPSRINDTNEHPRRTVTGVHGRISQGPPEKVPEYRSRSVTEGASRRTPIFCPVPFPRMNSPLHSVQRHLYLSPSFPEAPKDSVSYERQVFLWWSVNSRFVPVLYRPRPSVSIELLSFLLSLTRSLRSCEKIEGLWTGSGIENSQIKENTICSFKSPSTTERNFELCTQTSQTETLTRHFRDKKTSVTFSGK